MDFNISQIFFLMNILVNCKKPVELLDKTKEHIDEKPNQSNEIAIKFQSDIDKWFEKIIKKSVIILICLFLLSLIFLYFNNNLFWILVLCMVYVVIFLIDKYQNKYVIKKKLVDEIEDYANKNGIHYEKAYGY